MSRFIFAYLCMSRAHKSSNLRSQMSGKSQLSFSDQYPNLKWSFRVVRSRCKMKHYGTCDFSMSCFILAYLCMSGAHKSSNLHSLRSGESQLSYLDQYSYQIDFLGRTLMMQTEVCHGTCNFTFLREFMVSDSYKTISSRRCGSLISYLSQLRWLHDLKSCLRLQVIPM